MALRRRPRVLRQLHPTRPALRPRRARDGQHVRFGAAGGEDDLVRVAGPKQSRDLLPRPLDGGSRDAEHRARAALRTDRPVAGAYVDEVPLAFVYSRAGAWR